MNVSIAEEKASVYTNDQDTFVKSVKVTESVRITDVESVAGFVKGLISAYMIDRNIFVDFVRVKVSVVMIKSKDFVNSVKGREYAFIIKINTNVKSVEVVFTKKIDTIVENVNWRKKWILSICI